MSRAPLLFAAFVLLALGNWAPPVLVDAFTLGLQPSTRLPTTVVPQSTTMVPQSATTATAFYRKAGPSVVVLFMADNPPEGEPDGEADGEGQEGEADDDEEDDEEGQEDDEEGQEGDEEEEGEVEGAEA